MKSNPVAMRAMNHPLRWRLYYALIQAESATATQLAEKVDESVSLVSYHLRQLAKYGYIEPDSDPSGDDADGRHRWWRPTSSGFSFISSDFDGDPEAAASLVEARRARDAQHAAYRHAWLDDQGEWSADWRDAAVTSSNPTLKMTPTELADFSEEYANLVQAWKERLDAANEDPAREDVMISMQAFPFRP